MSFFDWLFPSPPPAGSRCGKHCDHGHHDNYIYANKQPIYIMHDLEQRVKRLEDLMKGDN